MATAAKLGRYVYNNVKGINHDTITGVVRHFATKNNIEYRHIGTNNSTIVLDFKTDLTVAQQSELENQLFFHQVVGPNAHEKSVTKLTDTSYQYNIASTFPNGLDQSELGFELRVLFFDEGVVYTGSSSDGTTLTLNFQAALTTDQRTRMENNLFPLHRPTNKQRQINTIMFEKVQISSTSFVDVATWIYPGMRPFGPILHQFLVSGRNNTTTSDHEVRVILRYEDTDTTLSTDTYSNDTETLDEMTVAGQNTVPEDASLFIIQLRKVSGTPAAYLKSIQFIGMTTAVDLFPVIFKKKTRRQTVGKIDKTPGRTVQATKRRRRN